MVQFDDDTRAALFSAGVLAIDADGKTVFTGLTATETRFVIDFEAPDIGDNRENSLAFAELLVKFHAARAHKLLDAEQLANDGLSRFFRPASAH